MATQIKITKAMKFENQVCMKILFLEMGFAFGNEYLINSARFDGDSKDGVDKKPGRKFPSSKRVSML